MIINITRDLDGNFKVLFTQRNTADSVNFKGLMIFAFKTTSSELFYNFSDYGRWLDVEDESVVLLLRLFRKSKQNTTSYYFS